MWTIPKQKARQINYNERYDWFEFFHRLFCQGEYQTECYFDWRSNWSRWSFLSWWYICSDPGMRAPYSRYVLYKDLWRLYKIFSLWEYIIEKLKSRQREQYLCNTMDEMQDVKPQRKKSIEEENFNADIDRILDRISDLLRNQVNRLKIKPLFEELEIFFGGVPASQS